MLEFQVELMVGYFDLLEQIRQGWARKKQSRGRDENREVGR